MSARIVRMPERVVGARTCVVCGSPLSAYNAHPTCWAHTLEVPWKGPNTRPK